MSNNQNKKVVSFCLYGNTKKYTHGIIEAVVSYKLFFIDWEIWIYVSEQTVPNIVIKILENFNCKIIKMCEKGSKIEMTGLGKNENNEPMFWRFLPLYDKDVHFWLTRDGDSRASLREKKMVDEFIESEKSLHAILDQRCHHGLMGCSSGFNNKKLCKYNIEHINNYINSQVESNDRCKRGSDQTWLRETFKNPIIDKNIFVHVSEGWFNDERSILNAIYLYNIKLQDLQHKVIDNTSGFIGKQVNVDNTPQDIKSRNNVYLPFAF